jgi:hypothetical protein
MPLQRTAKCTLLTFRVVSRRLDKSMMDAVQRQRGQAQINDKS